MNGEGLSLLEKRLTEKKQGTVGFDPTIIIAIISAIIPLIQNCFRPTPASLKRKYPNRIRLATAIKRDRYDLSWAEVLDLSDIIFDLASDATSEELQALIDDCKPPR